MSYDFDLYLPKKGLSHREVIKSYIIETTEKIMPIRPVASELCKQRQSWLKEELLAYHPELKIFQGHGVMEFGGRLSQNNYIQITLGADSAGVSIPYTSSKKGAEPRVFLYEVWEYLILLEREGGFFTYDTQMDLILDLKKDFEEVYGCYSGSSEQVNKFFDGMNR